MRTTSPLRTVLLAAVLLLPLAACKQEKAEIAPPPPVTLTADAVGHYCGMNLADHPGPKGQILVKGEARPIWLSSVRDTFAFTMLPEEPKEISAIYVTDVAKATDPAAPDMTAWVEARQAWYVLGSKLRGGMGDAEPYPFSDKSAAERFAQANGGKVLRFADVPEDQILAPPAATMAEGEH
ncbi:nitrous oxide reductase accessory protein NosL [Azospirillum sp. Sh1]|uniref:nitrous oxide reductase accessory protein NosL n=1 Tax=Azospirillum sp. Sh1 TaxID=2607285 RepID=UPI00165D7508|nr:nitrous oxide reductase accessory protein NosL [Azospirillum sp. Sh1]